MLDYMDVVFDGPPSHESGRFVEVEDSAGKSISIGEWVHRPDGYWVLRIPSIAELQRIRAAAEALADHYRRSVNVGPGPNPTRETVLWANLRHALGERP